MNFKCPICGTEFTNLKAFNMHMLSEEDKENKRIEAEKKANLEKERKEIYDAYAALKKKIDEYNKYAGDKITIYLGKNFNIDDVYNPFIELLKNL